MSMKKRTCTKKVRTNIMEDEHEDMAHAHVEPPEEFADLTNPFGGDSEATSFNGTIRGTATKGPVADAVVTLTGIAMMTARQRNRILLVFILVSDPLAWL
jgi:hypothetical protein